MTPSDSETVREAPPDRAKARLWRLVLVALTAGTYAICYRFPNLMTVMGVGHDGIWFMDTHAILAALDAQRLGMDPFAYNPLHHFGSPHAYSHWWLYLEPTGWTRADAHWLGAVVSGIGVASAWCLFRPRTWREAVVGLFVLGSAPVVFALNRANVDLLLFALLALCAPAIASRVRFWRIAGAPLLLVLATGLKFYPAAAVLVLLAIRPLADRRQVLFLALTLLAFACLNVLPDIAKYQANALPQGLYTFGAPTLFINVGLTNSFTPLVAPAALGLVGYWFATRTTLRSWDVPAERQREHLMFIVGALILTGSFTVTVNFAYRWIFALMMLPFLCRLDVADAAPAVRRLLTATRWLLGVALWSDVAVAVPLNLFPYFQADFERWLTLAHVYQQPFIWALFGCLSGWLAHFVFANLRPAERAAA